MAAAAGYVLALVMGLTLGLIGAGGSILTVPILVYFLNVPPVTATGYSLLIVGITALIGACRYGMGGLVNLRAACIFTVPAMLAVLYTRYYIVPALPDMLWGASKDTYILILFALLMLLAALFMLRPIRPNTFVTPAEAGGLAKIPASAGMTSTRFIKLILGSAAIGELTGLVGAGGGFLIIPTLIGLFGLQVKEAVGTSLAIIAVNSLVGFNGDIAHDIPLDWPLLRLFIFLTVLGMLAGTSLSHKIGAAHLRKAFGWFVLVVACAVLVDNLFG